MPSTFDITDYQPMLAKAYLEGPTLELTPEQQLWIEKRINYQYLLILKAGVIVKPVEGDPYADSDHMHEDIKINHQLQIFTGGTKPAPYGSRNFKSRAVHDWFHHMAAADFSLAGEFAAWQLQAKGEPTWYREVLFSEIVMQAATALHTGSFPEQRLVCCPTSFAHLL